jgi:hypothetical protein
MSKVRQLKKYLQQDITDLQISMEEIIQDYDYQLNSDFQYVVDRLYMVEQLLYKLDVLPMSDRLKAMMYGEEVSNANT